MKKRVTLEEMNALVADHRRQGKRVVLTLRSMDRVHLGHVTSLLAAAEQGDVLVVAAAGAGADLVGMLECVDHYVVVENLDQMVLQNAIGPNVLWLDDPITPEVVALS